MGILRRYKFFIFSLVIIIVQSGLQLSGIVNMTAAVTLWVLAMVLAVVGLVGFISSIRRIGWRATFRGQQAVPKTVGRSRSPMTLWPKRKADQALLLMLREQGVLPSQTDGVAETIKISSSKLRNEIQAKLRKLYKYGVSQWNYGMTLDTEEKVESWIRGFEVWEADVIAVVEKWSELDAADFETLRLMPHLPFPKAINDRHTHYLNVFSEKLARLNQTMQRLKDAKVS